MPGRYSRRYAGRNSSDGHSTFALVILLLCAAWAHKAAFQKAERASIIFIFLAAGIILAFEIYKIIRKIRKGLTLHKAGFKEIDKMTGLEFERYVAKLLVSKGYGRVKLTECYDLGVDIIAEKNGIVWGIQVKRYNGLVGADAVRQVVTALKKYNCDRAMVITNSYFSGPAKELAEHNCCVLVNRAKLLKLG